MQQECQAVGGEKVLTNQLWWAGRRRRRSQLQHRGRWGCGCCSTDRSGKQEALDSFSPARLQPVPVCFSMGLDNTRSASPLGSLRMSGMQLVERMFSPTSTGWTSSQATPGVGSWTLGTPRKIRQPQHSKASASSSTARLRPATTQRGFG